MKAGVISLSKMAAVDYGPDGIRVNAIAARVASGAVLVADGGHTA